jgi:HAD superfamily hydrolase (TIGR01509 family)
MSVFDNMNLSSSRGRSLRAVLFDWDGTLLDSAEAGLRCYERLFGAYGIAFDRDRFEATYSPDWYQTYERVGLPRAEWAGADRTWLQIYSAESCGLVEGAREALTLLEEESIPIALVTSGSRERVDRELERHDLAGRFRAVVCSEDVTRKKPHPEALHLGLRRLGVDPADAAYVGDSPEDVAMARAAGVFAVGVAGPFPTRKTLRASEPDYFAENLAAAARALLFDER